MEKPVIVVDASVIVETPVSDVDAPVPVKLTEPVIEVDPVTPVTIDPGGETEVMLCMGNGGIELENVTTLPEEVNTPVLIWTWCPGVRVDPCI